MKLERWFVVVTVVLVAACGGAVETRGDDAAVNVSDAGDVAELDAGDAGELDAADAEAARDASDAGNINDLDAGDADACIHVIFCKPGETFDHHVCNCVRLDAGAD